MLISYFHVIVHSTVHILMFSYYTYDERTLMSGTVKIMAVNIEASNRPVTSLKKQHHNNYRNQNLYNLALFAFRMIIQANGFSSHRAAEIDSEVTA